MTTSPCQIHDPELDALYLIDVKRANELGLHFYQTQSLAVLCDDNVPPECIVKVISMDNKTLYKDEYLTSVAPGDRLANVVVGPSVARANIFIDVQKPLNTLQAVEVIQI